MGLDARIERGLCVAGVAGGYYVSAVIGTVLSIPPFGFAILWPATAVLIAALLIVPVRAWWLYLVGVSLAHFHLVYALLRPEAPLAATIVQLAGNIGLAMATALAVRASGAPRFDRFQALLHFILLAGVVVPAVGNALIIGVYVLIGRTEFWISWRQWMLASVFPTITIPPLVALAYERVWVNRTSAMQRADLELVLLASILFGLSFVAFGWNLDLEWWPALLLAPLPFLIWAAARRGVEGTCLCLLVVAAAIIARALNEKGPFAVHSSPESMLSLQVFLIAISVPLVLLAALVEERRRTEELLKQSEARMEVVAAATDAGPWQWDHIKRRLWTTEHCRAMFGLDNTATASPRAFLAAIHEEDRARVQASLERTLTSRDMEAPGEFRVVRADGEIRWFVVRARTEYGSDGPIRVSGVFRDVTERVNARREAEALTQQLLTLQEEERRSIAENLHDSTAQDLVAVSLSLSALKRQIPLTDLTGRALDDILRWLNQATNDLRTFAYLLRPTGLDGEDLCAVLTRYVDGFGRRTGLTPILKINTAADRLPLDRQRAVLRIAQESLTNVHRHAAATRVSVTLRCIGKTLHLLVIDNGRGIGLTVETQKPLRSGVGIPGMTARIRQLGGAIAFRSSARGTIVHAAIPVAPEAAMVPARAVPVVA